jgi:hypothetical protein
MPFVYLASALVSVGGPLKASWLAVEAMGVPLYVGLAILGLRRPWFLVGGIALHGLAWDSWHLFTHSSSVPSWYALGCCLVDVALAAYLALRVATWSAVAPAEPQSAS